MALPVLLVSTVALHSPTVVGRVAYLGHVITTGPGGRTAQGPAISHVNSACYCLPNLFIMIDVDYQLQSE